MLVVLWRLEIKWDTQIILLNTLLVIPLFTLKELSYAFIYFVDILLELNMDLHPRIHQIIQFFNDLKRRIKCEFYSIFRIAESEQIINRESRNDGMVISF